MTRSGFIVFILASLLCASSVMGQSRKKKKRISNRFNASLILGLNLSQINGDRSTGFDKAGIYGGARGTVVFSHRFQLNVELLYSQKGSRIERRHSVTGIIKEGEEFIKVDYMEVPLMARGFLNKDASGLYLEGGGAYARRVRLDIVEKSFLPINDNIPFSKKADNFKSGEFSLIGGMGFDFAQHFSLGMRYTVGLTKIYPGDPDEPLCTKAFHNYFVSFLVAYHIR